MGVESALMLLWTQHCVRCVPRGNGIPGKCVAKRGKIKINNAIRQELQRMDVVVIVGVAILVSMTQQSVRHVIMAIGMNAA